MPKEQERQIRIAVVDKDQCNPQKTQYACMKACPVNRSGKECIIIDEDSDEKQPIISEALCIGCMLCAKACTLNALSIVNLTAKLDNPIHQFSANSFRLYKLPLPKQGSVVGLIGRNGIGKTTALKLLTAQTIPNLGEFEEEASFENVINYFKGKELQGFFESLSKKGITYSYKPQNVDLIQEQFKEKVKDLLKKVDENNKLEEIASELELTEILNHSIKDVSGGELQRIAIAACLLKKADFLFIDEPSSYLDVSQRLKVSKIIRKFAEEKEKAVMVVEHDLAVLDYLSDYIHILFGEQAVYGVVSEPRSVLNGINEYLEGFLKAENIRFREKQLQFAVSSAQKSSKRPLLISYPSLKKSFKSFSLSSEEGEFRKGEVLGVLGPNATGKTTFVKMLAGVLKPDNTKLNLKLKVSYKPQYLKPDFDGTVQELLSKEKIDKELFKNEVDRRLKISNLLEKNVKKLSGGELQKVALASALCRKADILLMDEPSAFIDVEDRLQAADAIRSVVDITEKACLVVDHDILFQDYVSDRLIVFEGSPGKQGRALQPMEMQEGMNHFLKTMNITYRRDGATGRPRANKPDSVKDQEQKKKGQYYYSK